MDRGWNQVSGGAWPAAALWVWIWVPVEQRGPFVEAPLGCIYSSWGRKQIAAVQGVLHRGGKACPQPRVHKTCLSLPLVGRTPSRPLRGGREAWRLGDPAQMGWPSPRALARAEKRCPPGCAGGRHGARGRAVLAGCCRRYMGSVKLSTSIHLLDGCLIRGIQP